MRSKFLKARLFGLALGEGERRTMTEKELAELIEQVESQEMLHAPVHLKHNVMEQIRRERRSLKSRQVFIYRVKVLAAMAAALVLLILMPGDFTGSRAGAITPQMQDESLEQMAIQRQEDIDANWERYLAGRENGGVRGFFRSINEKVTELAGMHDSSSTENK